MHVTYVTWDTYFEGYIGVQDVIVLCDKENQHFVFFLRVGSTLNNTLSFKIQNY